MKLSSKGIVVGALMLGAFASTPARAAVDSKVYPGSMCKMANSSLSSGVYSSTNYSAYLQNYAATIGVTCPVVRDQLQDTTPASAWVSVYDPTTTGNIWCGLYSVNSVAGTISYAAGVTTDPFKGNDVVILSSVPTGSGWWDSLNIKCSLPESSRIYSYNVDETVQTD
jgi:hypothetical protein